MTAALRSRVLLRAAVYARLKADGESDDDQVQRLIAAGGAALALLGTRLANGEITKAQFIERATAALGDRMQDAGALTAGDALDADALDALLADRADYLNGFAEDIAAGDLSVAELAARGMNWAGLVHTAWQMGKGDAAEAGGATVITWICKDDKSSCADCPDLAAGSPYTFETLPTYPGDQVACGGNCRCELDYATAAADEEA